MTGGSAAPWSRLHAFAAAASWASSGSEQWDSGVSFERVMSGVRPAAHNCNSDEQTAGAADGHWNRALHGPNPFVVSCDTTLSAGKTANSSILSSCRSKHCKVYALFWRREKKGLRASGPMRFFSATRALGQSKRRCFKHISSHLSRRNNIYVMVDFGPFKMHITLLCGASRIIPC